MQSGIAQHRPAMARGHHAIFSAVGITERSAEASTRSVSRLLGASNAGRSCRLLFFIVIICPDDRRREARPEMRCLISDRLMKASDIGLDDFVSPSAKIIINFTDEKHMMTK